MSYPQRRYNNWQDQIRANNRIRAREVRVINGDGTMLGVMSIQDALVLARNRGVDLVEISSHATPPVCKLVDIGKYRYDAAKREKEAKKKQHTTKLKEIQLRPFISERDLQVKMDRAIGFFCNDMKVRLVLRFRGRELRHKEFGFEVVRNFIKMIAPFASAYGEPKFLGRGITVMLTPLPRSRRAKNPKGEVDLKQLEEAEIEDQRKLEASLNEEEKNIDSEPANAVSSESISQTSAPVKKKQSAFGAPVLDDINLEISPKNRHHITI